VLSLFSDRLSNSQIHFFLLPTFTALAAVTAASMVKTVSASRLTRSDALEYKSPICAIDTSCLFHLYVT
jgi:hypothetical protein